jgi:hypothetical protein
MKSNRTIKKIILASATLAFVLSVSGCDKKSREEDKAAAQSFSDSTKDFPDHYVGNKYTPAGLKPGQCVNPEANSKILYVDCHSDPKTGRMVGGKG